MTALTPVISGNTHSAPAATQGTALQPRATGAGASAAAVTAVTDRPVSATDCRLEKAVLADKQVLMDIITAYEASLDGRPNLLGSDITSKPIKGKYLKHPAGSVLGIYKITAPGGKIIGFFTILPQHQLTTETEAVLELATCLHPDHHGKGIGSEMKKQLLAKCLPSLGTSFEYTYKNTTKTLPITQIISGVNIRNTVSLIVNLKNPHLQLDDIDTLQHTDTKELILTALFKCVESKTVIEAPALTLGDDGLLDNYEDAIKYYITRLENKATRDEAIRVLSELHTRINALTAAEKAALFEDSDDDE